jgi:hypothetical protein
LKAYGHSVNYQNLKQEFGKLSFSVPLVGSVELDIGLGGKSLAERIAKYEPSASYQDFSTFNFVRKLLTEGKPVGALLYLGMDEYEGAVIPKHHWVVVSGFDDSQETLTYCETDDEFGPPSRMSYQEFLDKWQWKGWDLWSGSAGREFVSQASVRFSGGQNGIFWIDRPLPSGVVTLINVSPSQFKDAPRTTVQSLSFDGKGVDSCSIDRAFEEAKDICKTQLGLDSREKALVLFPKTENYWDSAWAEGWNEMHCEFHVRDAVCASAHTPVSGWSKPKKDCGVRKNGSIWTEVKGAFQGTMEVTYKCSDGNEVAISRRPISNGVPGGTRPGSPFVPRFQRS